MGLRLVRSHQSLLGSFLGGRQVLMLADKHNQPSVAREGGIVALMSGHIGGSLLLPPVRIDRRRHGVVGAAVPATAIHEYHHPGPAEEHIRAAQEVGRAWQSRRSAISGPAPLVRGPAIERGTPLVEADGLLLCPEWTCTNR